MADDINVSGSDIGVNNNDDDKDNVSDSDDIDVSENDNTDVKDIGIINDDSTRANFNLVCSS